MSTSGISVNTGSSALSISGLASGLNTSAIISALMSAERQPVTRLGEQEAKLQAQQATIQAVESSLQQLSSAASEFALPSLFESSQTATSSEPLRVGAASSAGAGVGGYEVEVTQLANSAQRTFAFTSPAAEDTVTIDAQEFTLKAGGSAKELASKINADSKATVYAAALENGTLVLSSRTTGTTGAEFIAVSDTAGALAEVPETAKEGKDAEFTVDGVAGKASSNTLTTAIAGVTLTLEGLTPTGPVTIDVQPPGPSVTQVETQVQSFIKLYNSTVQAIQSQLATKAPAKPSSSELGVGSLFGDLQLTSLLNGMRQSMYEPISGLEGEMSSPADIGISTGAASGGAVSAQSSIEGQLTLDPAKLAEAIKANPSGVERMLQGWSQSFQSKVNEVGGPGGALEGRVSSDTAQITQLGSQITSMNEVLLQREKALQATYAQLEGVISKNTAQGNWLTGQQESLSKSGL